MKYFICGVGPGEAGTSKFYEYAEGFASLNGYRSLYPYKQRSFRRLYAASKIKVVLYLLRIVLGRVLFAWRVLKIRNTKIIIAHPQGIGLLLTMILIKRNSDCSIYVLDNSLFCIKSYNYYDGEGECVDCLSFRSYPKVKCKSFPGYRFRFIHVLFQKFVFRHSKKMKFFFQNACQKHLYEEHFRRQVTGEIVGLVTSDMSFSMTSDKVGLSNEVNEVLGLEKLIVFHAGAELAKGYKTALRIAKEMPDYVFVFPFSHNGECVSTNCKFVPCSWDSGLKELVAKASAVLCLSEWSAPIEGALIKSIIHNGVVVVAKTKHGMSNELPTNAVFEYESFEHIEKLKLLISDKNKVLNMKAVSQEWVRQLLNNADLDKIFREN